MLIGALPAALCRNWGCRYLTLAMQEDLSKIELVSATPSVSRMSSLDDNAVARTIRDSLDVFLTWA